jgi:hypothetical protein
MIRFYNSRTGQIVTQFDVRAPVTSLHWSSEYREFAATFGYRDLPPDVDSGASFGKTPLLKRAAVFAYPSFKCIMSMSLPKIEHCALYSINTLVRVPGYTRDGVEIAPSIRGGEDLIVASMDESLRFYKIWAINRHEQYPSIGIGGGKIVQDEDLGGGLSGLGLR